MRVIEQTAEARFNYISINGLAVTYDTSVIPSSQITGKLTASSFTDRLSARRSNSLVVNLTVSGSSSGTLGVSFLVLDPMEPSNGTTGVPPAPLPPALVTLPVATSISGPATIRLIIANGQATAWVNNAATELGAMSVPMLWQLQLTVSGSVGVIATFEEKQ
jgi:hypothetical protein